MLARYVRGSCCVLMRAYEKVAIALLLAVGLYFSVRSVVRKMYPDEEPVALEPYVGVTPSALALDGENIYYLSDGTREAAFLRKSRRGELRAGVASPSTVVGEIPIPLEQRHWQVRVATTDKSVVVAATALSPSANVANAKKFTTRVWRTDKVQGTTEEIADLGASSEPFVARTEETVYYLFWDIAKQRHRVLAIGDGGPVNDVPGVSEAIERLAPAESSVKPDVLAMFSSEGRLILHVRRFVGSPESAFAHYVLAIPPGGGPAQLVHARRDGAEESSLVVAPLRGGIAVLQSSGKGVSYSGRMEHHDNNIYFVSYGGTMQHIAAPTASHGILIGAGDDLYTTDCRRDSRPARCTRVVVTRLRGGNREVMGPMDWADDFNTLIAADENDVFFGAGSTVFRFPLTPGTWNEGGAVAQRPTTKWDPARLTAGAETPVEK